MPNLVGSLHRLIHLHMYHRHPLAVGTWIGKVSFYAPGNVLAPAPYLRWPDSRVCAPF